MCLIFSQTSASCVSGYAEWMTLFSHDTPSVLLTETDLSGNISLAQSVPVEIPSLPELLPLENLPLLLHIPLSGNDSLGSGAMPGCVPILQTFTLADLEPLKVSESCTVPSYECPSCNKAYRSLKMFNEHVRRLRCGIAPRYCCQHCNYRARKHCKMRAHLIAMHPSKNCSWKAPSLIPMIEWPNTFPSAQ